MLFSLYISDCTFKDPAVKLLKFEEDTTVIGLVQDSSAYGLEVEQLVLWCTHNTLTLSTLRTVEMAGVF